MNQAPEKLMELLRSVQLSQAERASLRAKLHAYALANPGRSGNVWAFFVRHAALSTVFGVLALVGGTTVLAQQALPGDRLYPVKLSVNDPVAVVLAGDEDAQIEKELRQIDRSIAEEEDAAAQELDRQDADELEEELKSDMSEKIDEEQERDQENKQKGADR